MTGMAEGRRRGTRAYKGVDAGSAAAETLYGVLIWINDRRQRKGAEFKGASSTR